MNSLGKKLVQNSYYNFVANVFNSLSRFTSSIIIARILGPTLTGLYSLVLFTYYIAEICTNLGLQNLATKYISQFSGKDDKESMEKVFSYVVKAKLLFTAIASVVLMFISGYFAEFYSQPSLKWYIIFFAIALFPEGIALISQSVVQGLQEYRALAIRNLLIAPIHVLLTILALFLHYGIAGLITVNLIISVLDFVIYYFFVKKRVRLRFKFDEPLSIDLRKRIFKYNWQVAIIVALDAIVWQRTGVLFLGKLSTQAEVAFYGLAFNFSTWTIGFLPNIFGGVLFPAISELHGSNETKQIEKLFLRSTRYFMMLSIPIAVGGIGLSSVLVKLLYGSAYILMAPVLSILLISICIGVISTPAAAVLYAIERQAISLKAGIIATIINITINLILIPKFGAVGAALANFMAQITAVIIVESILCKFLVIKFPFRELTRIIGSAIIMFISIFLVIGMNDGLTGLIASIIAGVIIYSFFIIRFSVLRVSDINALQSIENKLPSIFRTGYAKILKSFKKYAVADSL